MGSFAAGRDKVQNLMWMAHRLALTDGEIAEHDGARNATKEQLDGAVQVSEQDRST